MKQQFILLFTMITISMFAQNQSILDDFRFGAGVRLVGELQVNGGSKQAKSGLKFRLSATGGIANYIAVANNDVGLLPSVHIGVLFYNKGLLGSNLNEIYYRTTFFDFFANATLTAGIKNTVNSANLKKRFVPLYHFADFTVNPLQNTFDYSISLGSNWLMNPDINRSSQTIGFFNINVARTVQLSYYNDGGPILSYFGDGEDRYYTGGFVLSVHHDSDAFINQTELSFHKFTGWQQYAVDAADKLQLDYIPYKNGDVFGFNQQRWRLHLTSFRQGYSGYISLYDIDALDVQDALHYGSDFPMHPDYFYNWRFAIGGSSQFIKD